MAEVTSLAAMSCAIDVYADDKQEVAELSEQACVAALRIAMQTEVATPSAIMILENQKAVYASHSLSVACRRLRQAPAQVLASSPAYGDSDEMKRAA